MRGMGEQRHREREKERENPETKRKRKRKRRTFSFSYKRDLSIDRSMCTLKKTKEYVSHTENLLICTTTSLRNSNLWN